MKSAKLDALTCKDCGHFKSMHDKKGCSVRYCSCKKGGK